MISNSNLLSENYPASHESGFNPQGMRGLKRFRAGVLSAVEIVRLRIASLSGMTLSKRDRIK